MNREINLVLNSRGKILIGGSAILFSISILDLFSSGFKTILLIGFSTLLIILIDWILMRIRMVSLEKLIIKREYNDRIFDGETVTIGIYIENKSLIGLYNLEIDDRYPQTSHIIRGSNRGVINVPPKSRVKIEYSLKIDAIGRHDFSELNIRNRDILGLFTITGRFLDIKKNIIQCYANIPKIDVREMAARGYRILRGPWISKIVGFGMDFKDIREYKPGDEIKRIDWKASARINKLMIREYEAEAQSNIIIVLDLSTNMFLGILGKRKYDYSAKTIAFILGHAIRNRDRIGFLLLGLSGYRFIPIETATYRTYQNVMEILSQIRVENRVGRRELGDINLGRILEMMRIKEKTLFLIISDLEEEQSRIIIDIAGLLRILKHEVVIISPLTPLFEIPLVTGIDAALYRIKAFSSIKARKDIEQRLIARGIPIINVGPEDLIPVVLMKLDEFARVTQT
jgi:uncharacterized protein (DUF58 family)